MHLPLVVAVLMMYSFSLFVFFLCSSIVGASTQATKGLLLSDSDSQVCFGPNSECCMKFEPGPPPKIESSCALEQPPPPPPSPSAPSPAAPPARDWRVEGTGTGEVIYTGETPLSTIVMHPNGQTAYFTENFRVRQLDLTQDPPVASDLVGGGSSGSSDGTGTAASFNNYITGLCFSPDASFMVVNDRGNNKLRKVDMNTLEVTTLMSGKANMDGGCAFKPDGNSLLVCQKNSNHGSGFNGILEVDFATGAVTEIAGASHGLAGTSSDGTGSGATFGAPSGIKITKDGAYAYISQYHDGDLRKMDLQTLEVTTVASVPKWCGDFTLTPVRGTSGDSNHSRCASVSLHMLMPTRSPATNAWTSSRARRSPTHPAHDHSHFFHRTNRRQSSATIPDRKSLTSSI